MANTDFGSGSRSPGGWGGSGSAAAGGQGGMGGQRSSAGNYPYRTGMPRAGNFRPGQPINGNIGNWNTGGATVGFGNQYGVDQNNGIQRGYPGTAGPTNRYIAQVPIDPVVASLAKRPKITQEDIPGFKPSIGTAPQGVPGSTGYYDMREALGYNPYAGSYPANPGGQFGPRTYNDGYQTMRSDKFQNNPAYGSPGGGLGQYNRQTTMSMNGGAGGYHHGYGGPR